MTYIKPTQENALAEVKNLIERIRIATGGGNPTESRVKGFQLRQPLPTIVEEAIEAFKTGDFKSAIGKSRHGLNVLRDKEAAYLHFRVDEQVLPMLSQLRQEADKDLYEAASKHVARFEESVRVMKANTNEATIEDAAAHYAGALKAFDDAYNGMEGRRKKQATARRKKQDAADEQAREAQRVHDARQAEERGNIANQLLAELGDFVTA
jgi:uncharacterized protein YicC (UPF0701 family)